MKLLVLFLFIWIQSVGYAGILRESSLREKIIVSTQKLVGIRYQYAGTSPSRGFDCSGLVYYVFKKEKMHLPRCSHNYVSLPKVALTKAKIGDIIVFTGRNKLHRVPGHIGVISRFKGNKIFFIHASSCRGVIESFLSEEYYKSRFLFVVDAFRRVK